jgi:hypothetical protein
MLSKFFNALSSSKLALVLVLLIILFSIAGAVLPQEGMLSSSDILLWQNQKPAITSIFKPIGLFNVFHSRPFLGTILLLGINTLTCTILRFVREGGFSSLKGPKAIQRVGFIVLHLSIVILLAGGFLSAAASLDGNILLTEGQTFVEKHDGYLRVVEGPYRDKSHKGFTAILDKVKTTYEEKKYLVDVQSDFKILSNGKKVAEGIARTNYPFIYQGFSFTQDETGFSPRLEIKNEKNGRLLVNSFIALKTFKGSQWNEYRDFLPITFFKNRVMLTLIPDHIMEDGKATKVGENPENPVLLVEMEDKNGKVVSQSYLPLGKKISMDSYAFAFKDLRRWSVFRVSDDPGYIVVCIALWAGFGALLLRYFQDIRRWFKE